MSNLAFNMLAFFAEPNDLPKSPPSPYFWMPVKGSELAGEIDRTFNFIMWISVISAVLLMGAMIYFVSKYRAKSRKDKPLPSTDHNTTFEVLWSVIPLPIVLLMFVWGFQNFVALRTTPKDAYEIHATAQKWKWLFTYENGYTDDVLHAPLNRNVRIIVSAVDVLHALYLPPFRQKIDAVPGRFQELWFKPIITGDFPLFCAEYCGTGHSAMITHIVVHEQAAFEKWLRDAEDTETNKTPLPQLGLKMFNQNGCTTCHSTDGTIKTGPSFKGVFGKTETFSDGSTAVVDENYIRQSVLEPQAKVVKGFPPVMPTFKGRLKDRQILGLIEFIKSQK
jgi:cytochrome c oxidase subunit 2